jgi:hypothetical protein
MEANREVGDNFSVTAVTPRESSRDGNSRQAHASLRTIKSFLTRSNNPCRNDPITQKPSSSRGPAKASSLHDSGYASGARSIETNSSKMEQKYSSVVGGKIPGHKDLFFFKKEADKPTKKHFEEVRLEMERLLLEHIRKNRSKNSIPEPVAIRLMIIGKTEAETAPYIVAICSPNLRRKAERFFKKILAKELCELPGQSIPPLKTLVIGSAPQLKVAECGIDVCYDGAEATDQTTYCGMPILLTNMSPGPYHGEERKATFGGLIKITTKGGNSKLYGMTAGHVLKDWRDRSADSDEIGHVDSSDNLEELSAKDLVEFEDSLSNQSDSEPQGSAVSEAWNFWEPKSFGDILNNSQLPQVAAGSKQPSHDWALFRVDSYKPNELGTLEDERHQLLVVSRPMFHDGLSDPVIMIGGSHGPKNGELSSLPARILIGCSETFVDAYMLELNNGNGETRTTEISGNSLTK